MVRWFANNLGLILLSVILAFFVWAVASLQQDPILENTILAQVVYTGQPGGGDVVSASTVPETVTVRLRAPQSVFDALNGTKMQVPVDLSKLGAGQHELKLVPVVKASPAQLLATRPSTATVMIEKMQQKTVKVQVRLIGTPAIGYLATSSTVSPTQVLISGTQSALSKVANVDAVISIDNARSSVEQPVRLVAATQDGALVEGVSIRPAVAQVNVPMTQRSNYRELAVCVKTSGTPADRYEVAGIRYIPQVVTVFGPNENIQKLPGCIDTLPISIDGAKQDIDQRVGLNVPPDVSLVNENLSIQVQVKVQAQQGSRTVSRGLELIGVNSTLTATISPQTVEIVLSGSLPQLTELSDSDVRVQVDATGLPAGVHQVSPTVITPKGITVQSLVPATVQVEVHDDRLTPAPSLSPSPSPSPPSSSQSQ